MALLVHLPLTGDLHNQGLAEITYTGTPVFKTTGKIGNSAFDLSHRVVFNCPSLDGIKTFSIAFWAKVNSDSSLSGNWIDVASFTDRKSDGSTTGLLRWETCYSGTWGISSHDNSAYNISNLSNFQAVGKDIWHHIIITVDLENNEVKEYQNGIVQKTATCNGGSLVGTFHLGENNLINGEIQDVRIYDNVLSQLQISELKKMLILHYPLDGNNGTLANENLILNGAEANQSPASVNESTFTDYFYHSDYATELMSNNTTDEFTMSYDYEVYGAEPSGSNAVQFYAQCNNSIISKSLIKISSANEKGHVSFTFKLTSTQAQSTFSPFRTRIRLQLAIDGAYIIIKKVKLENGNKATLWCPNSSDALYTALGYNDGIEYDTSGYKNNATGANNLSHSLDSPRYLASAVCNYSNGLTIPKIFSDTCNNRHMSFAFWLKRTADFEVYEEDIYNGIANIYIRKDYNNSPYRLFISWNHATDDSVKTNTWTMYNTPLDTWVHIVITFDSGLLKMYANGKLIGTSDRTNTGTYIQGNRGMSLGNFTGKLSDFRIYGIALSATDVQNLYEVSASIDSNGNAYSASYVED